MLVPPQHFCLPSPHPNPLSLLGRCKQFCWEMENQICAEDTAEGAELVQQGILTYYTCTFLSYRHYCVLRIRLTGSWPNILKYSGHFERFNLLIKTVILIKHFFCIFKHHRLQAGSRITANSSRNTHKQFL